MPQLDPLKNPMDPTTDRHVGQKNESVLLAAPGQAFSFPLVAHNITAGFQQVIVEARAGAIPRDFGQRLARKAAWPAGLLDPMRNLTPALVINPTVLGGPPRVLPIKPVGKRPIQPVAPPLRRRHPSRRHSRSC